MAETTRNHIFSKEINQVIIAAMVLVPISIENLSASDFSYERKSAFSGWSNQLNNTEHHRKQHKNSVAQNLFSEAFDHDKISLNFTQHSTTSTTG